MSAQGSMVHWKSQVLVTAIYIDLTVICMLANSEITEKVKIVCFYPHGLSPLYICWFYCETVVDLPVSKVN